MTLDKDIVLHIGSGLNPEQAKSLLSGPSPSFLKQQEEMKHFMSKTVEELAAGEKDALEAYEVIKVRGREFVVNKKRSSTRTTAVMMACFYAMANPAVDAVMAQANMTGHFMTPNGIELQRFIEDPTNISPLPLPPAPSSDEGKRNILIPDDPPAP